MIKINIQIETLIQKTELGKVIWNFKAPTIFETFIMQYGITEDNKVKYQFIISGSSGTECFTFHLNEIGVVIESKKELCRLSANKGEDNFKLLEELHDVAEKSALIKAINIFDEILKTIK